MIKTSFKSAGILFLVSIMASSVWADDFTPIDEGVGASNLAISIENAGAGTVDLEFGFTLSKTLSFNFTQNIFDLNSTLNINTTGEALRMGNGTAADHVLVFDDDGGTDRQFGWDESEGALSVFGNTLKYRLHEGANPPATCSSTWNGSQWRDTDTGILYSCDTSNSRSKWLSVNEYVLYGESAGTCANNEDLATTTNSGACVAALGDSLGADTATDLGLHLPYAITITGYGVSTENDDCPGGSGYDLEVWGTGSASDDNSPTLATNGNTIVSGLTGEAHSSNAANRDVPGNQYIIFGLDNNCGSSGIQRWNAVLYYRYHHS